VVQHHSLCFPDGLVRGYDACTVGVMPQGYMSKPVGALKV
jgi:hypothetical protein